MLSLYSDRLGGNHMTKIFDAARSATAVVLALFFAQVLPAAAQDYPNRPITLIVPYPAGGGVDAMGRLVGQKLSVALGQQVVIENRGGAGGMIGTRDAARAAPDGANTGYDLRKDFAPIGLVAS